MREPADAAARGRREAARVTRRGAGGADRKGAYPGIAPHERGDDASVRDEAAVPGHGREGLADVWPGREGPRLLHDEEAGDPAAAHAAAVPKPRQPRDLDRAAGPLPGTAG